MIADANSVRADDVRAFPVHPASQSMVTSCIVAAGHLVKHFPIRNPRAQDTAKTDFPWPVARTESAAPQYRDPPRLTNGLALREPGCAAGGTIVRVSDWNVQRSVKGQRDTDDRYAFGKNRGDCVRHGGVAASNVGNP